MSLCVVAIVLRLAVVHSPFATGLVQASGEWRGQAKGRGQRQRLGGCPEGSDLDPYGHKSKSGQQTVS